MLVSLKSEVYEPGALPIPREKALSVAKDINAYAFCECEVLHDSKRNIKETFELMGRIARGEAEAAPNQCSVQ